ncbi:MAG: dCTP deaminase [Candidatus Bathyarchaeia archaeon]
MSDRDLKDLFNSGKLRVEPLHDDSIQQNGIDFRISDEIAECRQSNTNEVMDSTSNEEIRKFYHIIAAEKGFFVFSPLHHYLLLTKEKVKMPSDIMGFCALRSTFARLGFVSPLTVIDAGFEGTLTIGVFYGGNVSIKVPVGCRFLHVVFGQLKTEADLPYQGHYKMQKGISTPKSLK